MIVTNLIAHRGASAYAPENTMAAFKKAAALGARCVEFDVMLSADGDPFVFHDDTLNRTTNGRGGVGQTSSLQLKSLDAGAWFSTQFKNEAIPSFRTVIRWLIDTGMHANIELKPYPGTMEQTTTTVLSQLNQYWPADKPLPLISSFDWDALALCRSLAPEMPLGLLLYGWDKTCFKTAKKLDCVSIHINNRSTTPARIREIKDQGYAVYVYTINRKRRAIKLLHWGVDAVFTDYPDLLT